MKTQIRPTATDLLAQDAISFSVGEDRWLGAQFGKRVLRVDQDAAGTLPQSALASQLEQCGFAYARVPTSPVDRVLALQSSGFRVIDTVLSFSVEAGEVPPTGAGARFARPADKEAVADIAGRSFVYSRFHLDPAIPRKLADDLKRRWAGNFFSGERGDAMIVAEVEGRVAGFLQVITREGESIIDLIATAREAERRGVARGMIYFLANHGNGRAVPKQILVSTQAANVPSCRLYESTGFRLTKSEFTLHFHGDATWRI